MSPVPQSVVVDLDVAMQLRDGVTLRANIYRPGGEGRWPVLLTRLPYGKDFPLGTALLDPLQAARRGYVVVVQDTRGTGQSDGEWYPFVHEGRDGVDTIAWAAGLPYSDGQVGTYGASYFGFTQWAAAVDRPPALKAMVPFETWRNTFNGLGARGGAMEFGVIANWHLNMGLNVLLRRYAGDPQALGAAIYRFAEEMNRLGPAGYWALPLRDFAPLRRQDVAPAFFDTVAAPLDPTAEPAASAMIAGRQTGLLTPTLNIGGWYDVFLGDTIANFQTMRSQGAPAKLLIGPWSHSALGGAVGTRNFGMGAQSSFINLQTDLLGLHLRWFDHWLKGIDTGIMAEPPVKIFVMGANVWRDEQEWPLARAHAVPYYLHGGGRLGPDAPWDEAPDVFMYDPADPVPTCGGATLLTPEFPAGPYDQAEIEARPDVLVYTSDVLGEDLEVTGPIEVHLWAVSSALDTDFVARLTDVFPDGRSINLTDGIVRARYRNYAQGEAPSLLEPGRAYHYVIDLWATSNVFQAGHRIRLQITSSSFPRWDRNPNTGHPFGADAELTVAWQTILHDVEHPSHVVLPIIASEP
jgi:putative CocE/NonD family hydrolase